MNFKKVVRHPIKSFRRNLKRVFRYFLSWRIVSDKTAIKLSYYSSFHKRLNLKNPQTFNEKLNWLKINFRKPVFSRMVNKEYVKSIVTEKLGENYVIPTIKTYKKWKDIDFNSLKPPFVIKTTHSSGVVFVIKDYDDKKRMKYIKKGINKSLKHNYFYRCREWPYKDCERFIIIEEFISDLANSNLPVYKFFCFNGCPKIVQTIQNDKTSYETIDYFDIEWNLLDLRQNFPNSKVPFSKPDNLDRMVEVATKLSQGFPFIRIDLYSLKSGVLFSEFTFFSDAGYAKFFPEKWDLILGNEIDLSKVSEYEN